MSRGTDLYTRWASRMRRAGWFAAGDGVGAAVSGGPDSMLLLAFMEQWAREVGFCLAVVHFNHRLRGQESDDDEQFVRERARELGIEFIGGRADTVRTARERHRNLEATARELRYRFFFALVRQGKLDRVVTAHTANDQAETVLLRLVRGTGVRGLGGIYPLLDGKIARPFLGLTRAEIAAELARRRLAFRVDSSNRDPRFARNRVRAELLPLLEKAFNPAILRSLERLADRARDEEAFLEQTASERARPWKVADGRGEKIPVRRLAELPPALERRVLRQMIAAARGDLRGITHDHIESLRHFAARAQSGRRLELPDDFEARKEFDWLIVGPASDPTPAPGFCYPVTVPGEIPVPELGKRFRFEVAQNVDIERTGSAYNTGGELALDLDALPGVLVLRNWRPGDRFWPSGRSRPLRLKVLFREHKISLLERRRWPVLESGKQIVWVRGFPPPRAVAASGSSRRRLVISEESLTASKGAR